MDDRDVIDATRAFLDEFDAAGSDDEPSARRASAAHHAGLVTAAAAPKSTLAAKRAKKKPPAKPRKPPVETVSSVAETIAQGKKKAPAITETVPLVQPKTRKEELEFMRDQVKELEEKLRLLKRSATKDDRITNQQAEQISGGMSLMSVQQQQQPKRVASMWEELAMRQYQQRQRAEVENLKLKSSLEDQLKVAKSLQRMLKRSKCDVLTPKNHAKRGRVARAKSPAEEAADFEELSSTVTAMRASIDEAFADERFETADVDFRDVNVRQDEAFGTTIEVLSAKMVPFDFRTTAKAIWDYFVYESMDAEGYDVERNVKSSEDVMMKSFRFELEIKRYFGRFRAKIAGRRYREKDRIIIVWAVLGEPVEVSDAPMDGILVRQHGWTIVRRPTDPDLSEGATPVSIIQMKNVAIPTLLDDHINDPKRKLDLVTNFVLYVLFHNMETSQQFIENILFESMKQPVPDHHVDSENNPQEANEHR